MTNSGNFFRFSNIDFSTASDWDYTTWNLVWSQWDNAQQSSDRPHDESDWFYEQDNDLFCKDGFYSNDNSMCVSCPIGSSLCTGLDKNYECEDNF